MPTVLIVDDEPGIRLVLRTLFERSRFSVLEAASPAQALAALAVDSRVDAVVTDVLMPVMSGVAFYDVLVAQFPALRDRIIFLSGMAGEPLVQFPIEQRGAPILSKLDDLRLVVDAVRLAILGRAAGAA